MWLLVLVWLQSLPGVERMTVLETYPTYQDCGTERNRIGFAMAEAYPYERNFVIECRPAGCRSRGAHRCGPILRAALWRPHG